MTREEAINEINKVFTSAYANYIVTALTEGATVSDIQHRWGRAYEAGVKDGLEQEPCEDVVSRSEIKKIAKEMYLEVANMELDVNTISDCISYTASKCREVLERKLQALPSVTPQEPKTGYISIDDVMSVFDDFMCGEVDEDGTETFLKMLKDKAESEIKE